jgi:predicted N-formylglutamate amidohydrolase
MYCESRESVLCTPRKAGHRAKGETKKHKITKTVRATTRANHHITTPHHERHSLQPATHTQAARPARTRQSQQRARFVPDTAGGTGLELKTAILLMMSKGTESETPRAIATMACRVLWNRAGQRLLHPFCRASSSSATTRPSDASITASYEIVPASAQANTSAILTTCEHASATLPAPYEWPVADRRLAPMHWASDLGSAAFTREWAARTRAPALLSRVSRLLVDVNRPENSPTLFRDMADGQPVALNTNLTTAERARRLDLYYRPYHAALATLVQHHEPALLLSIHSYTDVYEGSRRDVEIGVLCTDADESLAVPLVALLRRAGYDARLNEPWSGKLGLMYAADSVAIPPHRRALMLEFRQDLCVQPEWRRRVMNHLIWFFRAEQLLFGVDLHAPITKGRCSP